MASNSKVNFDPLPGDLLLAGEKNHEPSQSPIFSLYADQELYQDLIEQFVLGLKRDLTSLEEAIGSHKPQLISNIAHKIRGTAATFGFPGMASILAQVENATRTLQTSTFSDADIVFLRTSIDAVSSLHNRMIAALSRK
jgi:HPt (histidine-containing phosphotransfer) domain-containing protein